MPRYSVKGLDASGKDVHIVIVAQSQQEANEKALAREILVREVKPVTTAKYKIKSDEKLNFIRLLAVTIKSGLPILDGLKTILKENSSQKLQHLVLDILDDIERGESLSNALANREGVFDELTIALTKAGEASGKLAEALEQLYQYENQSFQFRKKLKSALSYPAVVLGFSFLTVFIFMGFIVPRFKETYSSFGGKLPAITTFLMDISDFVADYFALVLAAFIGLPILFFRAWNSPTYKAQAEIWFMKIPIFGEIYESSLHIRFARTLGTMLKNQVSFLDALFLASEATESAWFANAISRVTEQVRSGISFSESLEEMHIVPEFFLQMAKMGEKTGRLGELLLEAADFYQDNLDHKVSTLQSVLQPVVVIFLGAFIGFLALGLFLPMFNLPGVLK
ncbi:MAG: type II secretion system F family protein [Candidatus Hydrogenedentota bacterium]|nr:MAG: type II secretion system F family protein [Candidatus Hydrogenedentota bacterium]